MTMPSLHSCRTIHTQFFSLSVLILLLVNFGQCESFVIQQNRWMYQGVHPIGYDQACRVDKKKNAFQPQQQQLQTTDSKAATATLTMETTATATITETPITQSSTATIPQNDAAVSNKSPIVLLNGFGVGSFHQHRLMEQLFAETKFDRNVYGMDYLGQGRSWPDNCQDGMSENEKDLCYSGDTWVDQAICFMEEVVLPQHTPGTKIHLVGNSVGGHLAVFLAALRPDLIESVTLLNATPVWGLNLPGWSGQLPAPTIPRAIGRYLFDRMRDLNTIRRFLDNSYANRQAYDETLVQQIRECTEGMGGHAAFASILWSPPVNSQQEDAAKKSFYDCLAALECDVLVVFGKDDPWCKPAFAKKMLQFLDKRHPETVHRYVELSNVGHCPNHEAPQAVAQLLRKWISIDHNNSDNNRRTTPLVAEGQQVVREEWGDITVKERKEAEIEIGFMDRLATTFVG